MSENQSEKADLPQNSDVSSEEVEIRLDDDSTNDLLPAKMDVKHVEDIEAERDATEEAVKPKTIKDYILSKYTIVALGILLGIVVCFIELDKDNKKVQRCAGASIIIATLWLTEIIPLYVTSLFPVWLFPAVNVLDGKVVSSQYFNYVVFILVGGFLVALAMERWNLHTRFALKIMTKFNKPKFVLLGVMLVTWFLSMWVSNTACSIMMVSNVMSLLANLEQQFGKTKLQKFSDALLLGVACSANIGGFGTLIGTPPNLIFTRVLGVAYPTAPDVTFADWLMFGTPLSFIFIILAWVYFVIFFCPKDDELEIDADTFKKQYRDLGKMSFEEKVVAYAFAALAAMWLFRADLDFGSFTIKGWANLFLTYDFINDGTVAIFVCCILYCFPARDENGKWTKKILDYETTKRLPWNMILLFGGGFALAKAFSDSGLSQYLGEQLESVVDYPIWIVIVVFASFMVCLTQLTSNTATSTIILPIVASIATGSQTHPLLLMIPVTIAASCAFMIPVATPPNLVVFATNRLKLGTMVKSGIFLNILGVILITLVSLTLVPLVFDFGLDDFPEWAKTVAEE